MSNIHNALQYEQTKCLVDNREGQLLPAFSKKEHVNAKVIADYVHIKTIVDYIRLGENLFQITSSNKLPNRNWEKVSWSGFSNPMDFEIINHPCERIGFQLRDLSNERWEIIYDKFHKDIFTNILYGNKEGGVINVVTKINCTKFTDYKLFYNKILEYYRTYCHLGKMDLVAKNGSIGLRHILYHDPEVVYNPDSKCVQLDEDICASGVAGSSYSEVDTISLQNESIVQKGVEKFRRKGDIFNDEQKTKMLFNTLVEWFDANFLKSNHEDKILNTSIQINISLGTDNENVRSVSFFEKQIGKKIELGNFKYDTETKNIEICYKEDIKGKFNSIQRKAPIPDVCISILKLLSKDEIEQGTVQQQMALEFGCSIETIENRLKVIFKDMSIIHRSTGNSLVLVKRHEGYKHYLSLKSIEQVFNISD